jgi:hypothetical protein
MSGQQTLPLGFREEYQCHLAHREDAVGTERGGLFVWMESVTITLPIIRQPGPSGKKNQIFKCLCFLESAIVA